jgi:hypothetical protein
MTGLWQAALQISVVALIVATCAIYLRRVTIHRPPIGRFSGQDVGTISVLIVLTPLAYVHLPVAVVSALFVLVFCVAIQTGLEPLTGGRIALWIVVAVAAVDLGLALTPHWPGQYSSLVITNDVILGAALVGVTNLWGQTGALAKHVAILAGILAIYDPVATWLSPLMLELFNRLTGVPFAPMLSLTGEIRLRLGLGDCLMLALWPVVLAKAYGRAAAWAGALLGLVSLATITLLLLAGYLPRLVAVMSIFGPAVIIHYVILRVTRGPERTTAQWRAGIRARGSRARSREGDGERLLAREQLLTVLAAGRESPDGAERAWTAYHDGVLVGTGATQGEARRAARQNGCAEVPMVIHGGSPDG